MQTLRKHHLPTVFIMFVVVLVSMATGCETEDVNQTATNEPSVSLPATTASSPIVGTQDPADDSGTAEEIDADSDGFVLGDDCNDSDPDVNPGRSEIPHDRVDNNCDGIIDGSSWNVDLDQATELERCRISDPVRNPSGVVDVDQWLTTCGVTLVEGIQSNVVDLDADSAIKRALVERLGQAAGALEDADSDSAVGILQEFQDEVRDLRGINEGIFTYYGDRMVAQAFSVMEAILQSGVLGRAPGPTQVARLKYLGGPIVEHPKIYITYWGFGSSYSPTLDPDGVNPILENFLANIGGTGYLEPLKQYPARLVANGVEFTFEFHNDPNMLKGIWYDGDTPMPGSPSLADIQGAVKRSVRHFGYDYDAIYFIVTPPNRTWMEEGCAYHGSTDWSENIDLSAIFVDLPYQPEVCKKLGLSGADATTLLAFHELVEAITDPRLSDIPPMTCPPTKCAGVSDASWPNNFGWLARGNPENADLCGTFQGYPKLDIKLDGVTYAIQAHWSNKVNACVYF